MQEPKIIDLDLEYNFDDFEPRPYTNQIVIHHTGANTDTDWGAEYINKMHRSEPTNWAAIGYHFVIRKDGRIEEGRPHWIKGAHSQGDNYHTIGIHLSGNFNLSEPTPAQIEAVSMLVGYIAHKYRISLEKPNVVVGHRDLTSTACPGNSLYKLIPTIIGKAKYYQQH